MSKSRYLMMGIALCLMGTTVTLAQWPPPPNGPDAPGDPNRMPPFFAMAGQADQMEDLKEKINASDEEWQVIGPKLRRVMQTRAIVETRAAAASGGPRFDPNRPFPGPPGNDSFGGPGDRADGGMRGPGGRRFGARGFTPPDGAAGSASFPPPPEGFRPPRGPDGFGGPPPGRGRDFRRGPGPGPGGPSNAVSRALQGLQEVLDRADRTPEQIGAALLTVRRARQQAVADLASAQQDLLRLLVPEQEAILVVEGVLD